MNVLKVFTAFSGYDSQLMALDKLNINYECVGWSEIDKYAIQAHNAIYPQYSSINMGDISKINWNDIQDFDLFTYSFPCQDISNAGNKKGLEKGSGTRSSLLWECAKAIEVKRPKYLLMENVKALANKNFKPYLDKWEKLLVDMGYSCYTKVINSKDFNIPQNRERIFMVSILGKNNFSFPEPIESNRSLIDMLDSNVDNKYYKSKYHQDGFGVYLGNGIVEYKGNKMTNGDGLYLFESDKFNSGSIKGISRTLKASKNDAAVVIGNRIRRLTPKECFKLMGVSDENIKIIQNSNISETQQFKLAGNSIVVDVLYYIFKELFNIYNK